MGSDVEILGFSKSDRRAARMGAIRGNRAWYLAAAPGHSGRLQHEWRYRAVTGRSRRAPEDGVHVMTEASVVTRFKVARTRSPRHLAWVRSRGCCVPGCNVGTIHAHHVRTGAGTGMKPDDFWCVPACWMHHDQIHTLGQRRFEAHYRLNLRAIAVWLAFHSRALGILPPL